MQTVSGNKWFIRTVNSILAAAIISGAVAPSDVKAGLKDALGEMFLVSGTGAQEINTQRLRGYYGGTLSVRSPGRAFEIIQFARPKIDAGCGGVDIFFGSFSFINGAQFEQLIRAIVANAVGFAIKAAIQAMCNPCAGILQELEDAIRELNALAKNTCAIATAMFDSKAADKLMERGRKIGEHLGMAASRVADSAAAANKSTSEKPSTTAKGGDSEVAKSNPVQGNMVWRAAQQTMESGNNTLQAFLSPREVTEMVQSLFGTVILKEADATDAPCTAGVAAERCDNQPVPYKTIDSWDELLRTRDASPKGVSMLRCENFSDGCTRVRTSVLTLAEWGGIADTINLGLFGTVEAYNRSAYTPDSIIGAVIHKVPIQPNGANLSTRARQLVAVIPIPILIYLQEAQRTEGVAEQIGLLLSRMLPPFFEYEIARELQAIGSKTFVGQNVVDQPEYFTEQLKLKGQALVVMKPKFQDVADMQDSIYKLLKQSQDLTRSPVRSNTQR